MTAMAQQANILGDIRAESDSRMLQVAFYESADYRILLETFDRPLVVGRRGTGKSALRLRLTDHWSRVDKATAVQLIPTEDQVIGVRPLLARLGTTYNQLKSAARLAWKYALFLETLAQLVNSRRWPSPSSDSLLATALQEWRSAGSDICTKVHTILRSKVSSSTPPEITIGELARSLHLAELQAAIAGGVVSGGMKVVESWRFEIPFSSAAFSSSSSA